MSAKFVIIPVFLLLTASQEISPEVQPEISAEAGGRLGVAELAGSKGRSEECYSCLFSQGRGGEQEDLNCSLVVSSSQCEYCNTTLHCQSGLCRHFKGRSVLEVLEVPDNVVGLCTTRSTHRSVFPKDPLGRIISFGLLGLVLSVLSFIFLR